MAMDISGLNRAVLNTQRKLEQLTEDVEKIKSQIYPIGSIYISLSNEDPKTLFGGTWEKVEGKFLLSSSNDIKAGVTGGSLSHSHTLDSGYAMIETTNNDLQYKQYSKEFTPSWAISGVGTAGHDPIYKAEDSTALGGQTDADSTLPPYLVVNVWKRIS